MKSFVATSLILAAGVVADRSFTVVNKCSYTIWSVYHLRVGSQMNSMSHSLQACCERIRKRSYVTQLTERNSSLPVLARQPRRTPPAGRRPRGTQ